MFAIPYTIVFPLISTVAIILIVFLYAKKRNRELKKKRTIKRYSYKNYDGLSGYTDESDDYITIPRDHEDVIVPAITAIDSSFSREEFIAFAKQTFTAFCKARTLRDVSLLDILDNEELREEYKTDIEMDISLGQIHKTEQLRFPKAYLHLYRRDKAMEQLCVYTEVSMHEYVIHEQTQKIMKGDPHRAVYRHYLLTFLRKRGECDWVFSFLDNIHTHTSINERGVIIEKYS